MENLTLELINEAVIASPYRNGKFNNYFFLNADSLAIVEEGVKKGYLKRVSYSEVQWAKDGIEKARKELNN